MQRSSESIVKRRNKWVVLLYHFQSRLDIVIRDSFEELLDMWIDKLFCFVTTSMTEERHSLSVLFDFFSFSCIRPLELLRKLILINLLNVHLSFEPFQSLVGILGFDLAFSKTFLSEGFESIPWQPNVLSDELAQVSSVYTKPWQIGNVFFAEQVVYFLRELTNYNFILTCFIAVIALARSWVVWIKFVVGEVSQLFSHDIFITLKLEMVADFNLEYDLH